MKRLLNTLYVTTQGAYVHKEGKSVLVEVEKEVRLRVPIHQLSGIVGFGNVLFSPYLLGLCAENQVAVSCLTQYGRFLASVHGETRGNVLLRREQYRWADDQRKALTTARFFLKGKMINARNSLRRGVRDGTGDRDVLEKAAERLKQYSRRLDRIDEFETMRGNEGEAAKSYFSAFNELLTQQRKEFEFVKRSRRPPLDAINALLSFIYTLLMHDIAGALEAHGLDPYVGYLHRDRPGRKSLALDMLEEFRPWLADRLAVTLINRKQLRSIDFQKTDSGAVHMTDKARKKLLEAYQNRKQEEISHPYLDEKLPVGLVPHIQAQLLVRYIRGDLDGYPPFIWK